jgi:GT2 family glycosyltransferase
MAMTREVFEGTGGFDARFRAGEDVELSWRIQLGGTPLSYVRAAVVWKREPTNTRAVLRQYYNYGRFDPVLYDHFRGSGAPSPRARSIARAYGSILARVPLLWRPKDRLRCVQQLGRRTGRIVGSIAERVLYP